ncbi:PREDICTED: uncharacterized protein LOC109243116 [Nicotiana attenuata]|uniref:uncharacterized protein LOC109243116 n=1 Tax=Nicotiana attenuata TaxID=49451 RepID=UPI000905656D|nr:PREDICTED: uncharacterized protein LOC109243116 [Nicotiana attenuata]
MDNVDKSWMHLLRWTDEYIRGVNDFLDKAFERASHGNEILCPCTKCINRYWNYRNMVEDHLVINGFFDGYTEWVFHGEGFSSRIIPRQSNNDEGSNMRDDIDGLLHETFRNVEGEPVQQEGMREALSEDAKRFFKLLEEGKQELYPGCENFNKLSFTIRLYLFKSLHGLSNVAFSDLLELLKEAFPFAKLPEWKSSNRALTNASSKVPAKVLRYFPLKPRLQRIFMCPETAIAMRWHANERPNDENLRHPADGEAWKDFDSLHADFSKDPRNVRLGLSSDGFNPFRTMSISHSTWPVMLMKYNLSPWICMKPEYIMLSMIIPGPSSPGNDIDVYLQPLIAELKELWETGIETYDAETKQTFQMRAALLWTVSDFLALAMLSGWSTKGRLSCPTCNYDTCSLYLKHSHKMCYMGHRRFLPHDHPLRKDKKSFDGKKEHRPAPTPLSGVEVVQELLEFNNVFGRAKRKDLGITRVVVTKTFPKSVSLALIRLGNFFRAICSNVIRPRDLEKMNSEIVEINCELEKIFHPTFFDIMPHLPIHLVNEIKLGGPAHLRWMYPIERNLCKYKAFVRNRSSPEASIAEGFLEEECLIFCSRYLHDSVKTRFSRYPIVDDECPQNLSSIFPVIGHPIGSKKKNTFHMDPQLCNEAHDMLCSILKMNKEHKNLIGNRSRLNAWERARNHSREFNNWFAEKVKNIEVPDYVRWLAKGPNAVAKRYTAYFINGYRFQTVERDSRCKTQHSGVTLSATTDSFASSRDQNPIDGEVFYYGAIRDIIEIDYWGCFSVVLFRCNWVRNEIDEYGLTRVYFKKLCSTDDPFVLASQVYQVFYVEDPVEKDVYYARNKVPVDLYDLEEENCPNIEDAFWREPNDDIGSLSGLVDVDVGCSRNDVPVDVIDIPSNAQHSNDTIIETSEEENEFDDTEWDWMESDD